MRKIIKSLLNLIGYEIISKRARGAEVNYARLAHFLYFKKLYDQIKDVEGDIVECGVGYGYTFYNLCFLSQLENKNRKVWGFDSFEGFPEPSDEDRSPRNPKKGEWNVATIDSLGHLLRLKNANGSTGIEESFLKNNVRLVKGFFRESIYQFSGEHIAFLHLDVDLYDSYKVTLEHFWSMVAHGGAVLFDEYRRPEDIMAFPGASKAIDEYLGDLKEEVQFDKDADRYYIVKN